MPYATQQDMVERFGERELIDLTARDGSRQLDPSVLERALEDASAEVEGYLAGRYALPLRRVPSVLVPLTCDIARYRLLGQRPHEVARDRYKDAVRLLENVAKGQVQLGLDPREQAASPGSGPLSEAPGRVFTADTLRDF